MLLSLSIVAVLGIIWLVGSNVFLIFVIYRLNLLGRAKDLADFKYNVADETPEPPELPEVVQVDAF